MNAGTIALAAGTTLTLGNSSTSALSRSGSFRGLTIPSTSTRLGASRYRDVQHHHSQSTCTAATQGAAGAVQWQNPRHYARRRADQYRGDPNGRCRLGTGTVILPSGFDRRRHHRRPGLGCGVPEWYVVRCDLRRDADLSPNDLTVYIATGLTANNQAATGPATIN